MSAKLYNMCLKANHYLMVTSGHTLPVIARTYNIGLRALNREMTYL
jgi:hypothetical protein